MSLLLDFERLYMPKATGQASTLDMYRRRLRFIQKRCSAQSFAEITPELLDAVRQQALNDGISAKTIENSISDLMHILGRCGLTVSRGNSVRIPPPNPNIRNMEEFDAFLRELNPFWRCFFAVAYVTGLRKSDLFQLTIKESDKCITVTAGKTGKVQKFPIPIWLRRLIAPFYEQPFQRNEATLYDVCRRFSKTAGVERWSPQQVRIFSGNQWDKIKPGLGPLILGHSLPGWSRSTSYYIDPHRQLFAHVDSLEIPPCLKTAEETEQKVWWERRMKHLMDNMSERDLQTMLGIAERFVS